MSYFWNLLKNLDRTLLILPLIFAVISIVMIGSTAYDGSFVFNRAMIVQIVAYILGFFVMGLVVFFDYKNFKSFEKAIYIGSILFLLSVYTPLGTTMYGARGWLNLGIVYLQPAEVVKISFILIFANYLIRNKDTLYTFKALVKAGLYAAPFILLIILQKDLGNALVFCIVAAMMVFIAGVDGKLYAKIAGAALLCTPIMYRFMAPHQKERIDAFLHPGNMSLKGNYHVWHSKVAIGSGGFHGKGLFAGTQKELNFLPVAESDFIFAVIVEELGFLGGLVVIALYALFLYRIAMTANNAKDVYGCLVAFGILSMFAFQIFENIGMTMGLMPVTGITLPFISSGGSSIITNMVALGLILNIGIRSKVINF